METCYNTLDWINLEGDKTYCTNPKGGECKRSKMEDGKLICNAFSSHHVASALKNARERDEEIMKSTSAWGRIFNDRYCAGV